MLTRGLFNIDKHPSAYFINFWAYVVTIPWFITHRFAFHNHDANPHRAWHTVGYGIWCILAIMTDLIFAAIGMSFVVLIARLWIKNTGHALLNTLSSVALAISAIVFFRTATCRIKDLTQVTEYEEDEELEDDEEPEEELYFCQIFSLNDDTDLHIIKVEYCPEETAFIRIVGESSYTKPYKRKVRKDEAGNRFIEFNDKKYYLECSGKNEAIDIDKMGGGTFEHFCADLLRVNGWTDVRVTPASGDHGIDITAEKDDIKWGFQCKRWGDTKVDAIAIGQTYKGKALYECDMVAVITTSTLTAQAEGEAKQLGIKVWGRGKIRQLMSKLDNADDYYLSA